jgi:hypothetical protein
MAQVHHKHGCSAVITLLALLKRVENVSTFLLAASAFANSHSVYCVSLNISPRLLYSPEYNSAYRTRVPWTQEFGIKKSWEFFHKLVLNTNRKIFNAAVHKHKMLGTINISHTLMFVASPFSVLLLHFQRGQWLIKPYSSKIFTQCPCYYKPQSLVVQLLVDERALYKSSSAASNI